MLLVFAAMAPAAEPASALDAALARKCREMAIAAHPTQPAGSSSGHAAAQREYFNKCVANEGKMDAPADAGQQGAAAPAQKSPDAGAPPGAAR
jgi:hypothetical protein